MNTTSRPTKQPQLHAWGCIRLRTVCAWAAALPPPTKLRHNARCALIAVLAVCLAGCTTGLSTATIDSSALEQRAVAAETNGNLRDAADIYRQLAEQSRGNQRSGFLLEAARLEIDLNNLLTAAELLSNASASATGSQADTISALTARIDLANNQPAAALARLRPLENTPDETLRLAVLELTGRALFALEQPIEAIRSLSEREVWLDDIASIRANQSLIWTGLQSTSWPTNALSTGDDTVDGWIALGPIARIFTTDEQRSALIQWRIDHRQHPAARVLLTDLLMDPLRGAEAPSQIALLLPLSTPAREAALAIQDGFLAAHIASTKAPVDDTPRQSAASTSIRVYDTGLEGPSAAYLRAQIEGADFIVGPLLRPEVAEVLPQTGLIPTLALNFTLEDAEVFGNTYQFALAPEDEAVSVARHAIAAGQYRAVALIPSNDRGYRIYNSFREEFEYRGGEVLAIMGYDDVVTSYSARVVDLMNVGRSNQRERRLAANLGEPIEFEPRRRQDIDMIFLIANADDGSRLAPLLGYYYAGDVPTYGISEIHDPNNIGGGRDLNDIIFPDLPWLLAPNEGNLPIRRTIADYWPQRDPRFFGMGIDAYSIVGAVFRDPFFTSIDGVTGLLSMDTQGRIRRTLPFAQFRAGVPELLPTIGNSASETEYINDFQIDNFQQRFNDTDEEQAPGPGDAQRTESQAVTLQELGLRPIQ